LETSLKNKLLDTAREAALEAGKIHLKYYGKQKEISFKSNEFDLVTNVDRESEDIIIQTINNKFKDHHFIAEESDKDKTVSHFEWIIDPLDGTTNYAHNFPQFCVSICLMYKKELYIGIVYDALKNELFHAIKGSGAFLNDKPIHVSDIKTLKRSLLATGFPYDRSNKENNNLNYFESFLYESQAIRRPGSAALDMCYLACGRIDGFWELNLAPWDTAAGAVIVREAGGTVTNFYSQHFDIFTKNVLATNGHLVKEMTSILRKSESNANYIT
jgi:myo-inositol-1(or 4)-monophosphatase